MRSEAEVRQIRAALALAGLSGEMLAQKLGVSRQWVNRVIRGKRNRQVEKALMAAGAPRKLFPRGKKAKGQGS
jgi:transcriptional regulator with XRE-family HTH domain